MGQNGGKTAERDASITGTGGQLGELVCMFVSPKDITTKKL